MKKLIFSLSLFISFTINLNALPSVAICGFDAIGGTSTSGDEFAFVLIRDFTAGEVIYFTEDEYSDSSNAFDSVEGHLAYTIPTGGLSAGQVVKILESGANSFTVQCGGGSAVHMGASGNWSYSASDELYAYSASNPAAPWSSITEIHCFYYGSVIAPPANQDPSPDWPNTIKIAPNLGTGGAANADYIGPRMDTTIPMLQNPSNWSASTSDINISCATFINNLLPIDLISFSAKVKKNEVFLDWVTASEINNERFEVEHSTDGQNFTKIETLEGQGDSHQLNSYQTRHFYPASGVNYYRLKQVDFDGKYSYSNIEFIDFRSKEKTMSVFPNPFQSSITLELPKNENNLSKNNTNRTIWVYNVYGKLMKSQEFRVDLTEIKIDLSDLASGTYFLKTSDDPFRTTSSQRIIKI